MRSHDLQISPPPQFGQRRLSARPTMRGIDGVRVPDGRVISES
jgi:hypothetical protein